MKNPDKIENKTIDNDCRNFRDRISFGILDSLLAGISFYLGFILQGMLMPNSPFVGRMELLLLSLGMAFCYAFIFVYRRSYLSIVNIAHTRMVGDLAQNLILAYLLDLAMLFIMKDNSFLSFRTALGFGIILGFILLYAGRMASGALRYRNDVREGKRRLIIAGPAPAISLIEKSSKPDLKKVSRSADILSDTSIELPVSNEEEVHLDSQSMSSDDLLSAIDLLQDGKTRVVIHRPADIPSKKREPVSAGH